MHEFLKILPDHLQRFYNLLESFVKTSLSQISYKEQKTSHKGLYVLVIRGYKYMLRRINLNVDKLWVRELWSLGLEKKLNENRQTAGNMKTRGNLCLICKSMENDWIYFERLEIGTTDVWLLEVEMELAQFCLIWGQGKSILNKVINASLRTISLTCQEVKSNSYLVSWQCCSTRRGYSVKITNNH